MAPEDEIRIDLLRRSPLFATLSAAEIAEVASATAELNVPAGETLLSQATPGGEVVVLVAGAATVERDGTVIGSVEPGDVIGEVGVMTRMSRVATVTTTQPSHLLVIKADAFRALAERIPALDKGAWKMTASHLKP